MLETMNGLVWISMICFVLLFVQNFIKKDLMIQIVSLIGFVMNILILGFLN